MHVGLNRLIAVNKCTEWGSW